MSDETITIELGPSEADAIASQADAARVAVSMASSRRMTGEAALVTVVLPVTLTAVQVVAAFLIARRSGRAATPAPRITVRRKFVVAEEFTAENVAEIVGRPLDG